MVRCTTVVWLAVLAVGGCTGSRWTDPGEGGAGPADGGRADVSTEDAGPVRLDPERFFAERRRLRCEYLVLCGERDVRQSICHPALADEWERAHAGALAAGHVVFDADAAQRCLDALETITASCASQLPYAPDSFEDPTGSVLACEVAFVGIVPDDEPCQTNTGECLEGAFCYTTLTPPREHRCFRPRAAAEGEACRNWLDCGVDIDDTLAYECERPSSEATEGSCRRLGDLGAPCDPERLDCVWPLICSPTGVCAERAALGEACGADWDCVTPLLCADDRCTTGAAEGASCGADMCARDLYCAGDPLICRSGEGANAGDPCWTSKSVLGSSCDGDLLCDEVSWGDFLDFGMGFCSRGLPLGSACDEHTPCARGLACAGGTCGRAALPGEVCEHDDACPLWYYCDLGHCRPAPVPGERCDAGHGCLKGRCQDSVCCLVPEGGPCTPDPRGPEWDECEGVCFGDDRCGAATGECTGCDACWPTPDRCVPRCAL